MRQKKIKYKDIKKRITGVSLGPFGISWTPSPDKRDIIHKLIVFLEDRKVLFVPYHMEFGPWVVESVLEICKELTETLKQFPVEDPTTKTLRMMRGACRKFLQEYNSSKPRIYGFHNEMSLAIYLGELRGLIGLAIAQLCSAYKINVEPELASIFPILDKETKKEKSVKN